LDTLKTRLGNLFEHFTVKLVVIVIEIRLQGDVAYDYGWHDLTLMPKLVATVLPWPSYGSRKNNAGVIKNPAD
jgi:hypothetical protein